MPEPTGLNVHLFPEVEKEVGYKPSRFNMRTNDKNGNLLLLNTYSNSFIRVDAEDTPTVADILRNPNAALHDHPAFHELMTRGFIVEKGVDEFRRAELLHGNTIASSDHLSLTLLANEDCNFRCTYCYESFAKNFMQDWVQEGVIKYLEKNLHKYSSLHISWFGGEPLTAMPIIERISEKVIELCKKHRVVYYSNMTTNGYNLTLNNMKKLLKYRVNHFQITLDGIEETHNCTRKRMDGNETFARILRNLQNVRDHIANQKFEIVIRGNINRAVMNVIGEYTDMLSQEFKDDKRFTTHWSPVGNWGGEVMDDAILCTQKEMHIPMIEGAEKGVDFAFYQRLMQASNSVCYAAKKNNFIIGSDGIIYKCTVAFDDEVNHVGMISQNGTMHLDVDRFAQWVTGHETSDSGCQKCFYRPACQGAACPLVRIKNNEAPCPPFKTNFKDYLQVIAASPHNKVEDLKIEEVGVTS